MSENEQQAQILDVHVAFLRLTGVEPNEAGTLETRLLLADACEAGAASLRAAQTIIDVTCISCGVSVRRASLTAAAVWGS